MENGLKFSTYKNEHGSAYYDRSKKAGEDQILRNLKSKSNHGLTYESDGVFINGTIHRCWLIFSEMQGTFTGRSILLKKNFIRHDHERAHLNARALSKDAFTKLTASQRQKKVGGKLDCQAFSGPVDAEHRIASQNRDREHPRSYLKTS